MSDRPAYRHDAPKVGCMNVLTLPDGTTYAGRLQTDDDGRAIVNMRPDDADAYARRIMQAAQQARAGVVPTLDPGA
jgi:hypothetical protein